jgi:hypothetical protein
MSDAGRKQAREVRRPRDAASARSDAPRLPAPNANEDRPTARRCRGRGDDANPTTRAQQPVSSVVPGAPRSAAPGLAAAPTRKRHPGRWPGPGSGRGFRHDVWKRGCAPRLHVHGACRSGRAGAQGKRWNAYSRANDWVDGQPAEPTSAQSRKIPPRRGVVRRIERERMRSDGVHIHRTMSAGAFRGCTNILESLYRLRHVVRPVRSDRKPPRSHADVRCLHPRLHS